MTYKKFAAVFAGILLLATVAFAAGLINRDDQDIMGNWRFWNTVTFQGTNSALVLTDATITGTGKITATHIANPERSFNLDLWAASINGGEIDADATTAPGIATTDGIPAIVYATSAETNHIEWTFRLPTNYVSGLGFRMLISSDDASGAKQSIDWEIFENIDNTTFDAAAYAQDAVTSTSATLDASNDVVTFTLGTTAEAALAAGDWVTVDFFCINPTAVTTEIKGIEAYYTSTL